MLVSDTTPGQSWYSMLDRVWRWFIEALFPKRCLGCGRWDTWCCSRCFTSLHFRPQLTCPACAKPSPLGEFCADCAAGHYLDGLWPAQPYGHPLIRNLIKAFKFDGLLELLPIHVKLLNGLLTAFNLPPRWHGTPRHDWLLTAIPLHKHRQRQRNFNQAELLAISLAAETGLPYLPTLQRIGRRRAQSDIQDKKLRLSNIEGAFAVLTDADITDKTFILIDDVYTSGATMEECAKVLKAAGTKAVWGLTVAKG